MAATRLLWTSTLALACECIEPLSANLADDARRAANGQSWLDWENAIPVSLSLPLREDRRYKLERPTSTAADDCQKAAGIVAQSAGFGGDALADGIGTVPQQVVEHGDGQHLR